jgi:hypothetical protein
MQLSVTPRFAPWDRCGIGFLIPFFNQPDFILDSILSFSRDSKLRSFANEKGTKRDFDYGWWACW